jgi:hypothetical protein
LPSQPSYFVISSKKTGGFMKLLISIIAMISATAYGADFERKTINYSISDRTGNGERIFYNCDSVETKTKAMLKKLGAKDINVDCTGGLDRFGRHHMPAYVSADFMALNSELSGNRNVAFQTVKFVERNNCHFVNSSLKSLSEVLEISEISLRNCTSSRSTARASVTVLKETN